ncbi:hypothetical protein MKZ38_005566 [Zalerion maritima]|uniref:Fucose-specific lectin n=1 Tax=Zalerion maritima TaxID=339359 RepID=A0AAD5WQX8_9PEZI|nr:hypothetical protein MKZ38_005566 [Zalerion maritima]
MATHSSQTPPERPAYPDSEGLQFIPPSESPSRQDIEGLQVAPSDGLEAVVPDSDAHKEAVPGGLVAEKELHQQPQQQPQKRIWGIKRPWFFALLGLAVVLVVVAVVVGAVLGTRSSSSPSTDSNDDTNDDDGDNDSSTIDYASIRLAAANWTSPSDSSDARTFLFYHDGTSIYAYVRSTSTSATSTDGQGWEVTPVLESLTASSGGSSSSANDDPGTPYGNALTIAIKRSDPLNMSLSYIADGGGSIATLSYNSNDATWDDMSFPELQASTTTTSNNNFSISGDTSLASVYYDCDDEDLCAGGLEIVWQRADDLELLFFNESNPGEGAVAQVESDNVTLSEGSGLSLLLRDVSNGRLRLYGDRDGEISEFWFEDRRWTHNRELDGINGKPGGQVAAIVYYGILVNRLDPQGTVATFWRVPDDIRGDDTWKRVENGFSMYSTIAMSGDGGFYGLVSGNGTIQRWALDWEPEDEEDLPEWKWDGEITLRQS